jgi:outer membrane protein assembly factor BamB
MQLTHSLMGWHGLQKLPSSIKDIVNNSPFLAADGTLFVGSKDSQIFTLELETGNLASVHSTKGLSTQLVPVDPDDDEQNANQVILPCARPSLSLCVCVCVCAAPHPIPSHGTSTQLFIMRTDYTVRAINHKSGEERWNVTVSEFTSDLLEDSSARSPLSLSLSLFHARARTLRCH